MIPVAQHIPVAYLRPLPSVLPQPEPELLSSAQSPNRTNREQVIEAEWRPIFGPPAQAASLYKASSEDLAEGTSTPAEIPPLQAAARYQQMTSQSDVAPGAILNIQA